MFFICKFIINSYIIVVIYSFVLYRSVCAESMYAVGFLLLLFFRLGNFQLKSERMFGYILFSCNLFKGLRIKLDSSLFFCSEYL